MRSKRHGRPPAAEERGRSWEEERSSPLSRYSRHRIVINVPGRPASRALGGGDELRGLHFGPRDWDDSELGIAVDDAPLAGRFGDSILAEVRRHTVDPQSAVNIVLPERIDTGLRRLRGPSAIAIKRCLLFEPHVILSSVPTRA